MNKVSYERNSIIFASNSDQFNDSNGETRKLFFKNITIVNKAHYKNSQVIIMLFRTQCKMMKYSTFSTCARLNSWKILSFRLIGCSVLFSRNLTHPLR